MPANLLTSNKPKTHLPASRISRVNFSFPNFLNSQKNAILSTLVDQLPLKLVLKLAAPYLAGKDAEAAIGKAHALFECHHFCSTLDILGEDANSLADCEATVEDYKRLIDAVSIRPLPVRNIREQLTISFKPSMFSIAVPRPDGRKTAYLEEAFNRIAAVVDYAFQKGVQLTLEAEDHRWADFQLETYWSLIEAGYTNLGIVLQTRLFRTKNDLKRFDERMRVRLVIGIYQEPEAIAFTNKAAMKDALVQYAGELLDRGTYVEVATHDRQTLDKFFSEEVIPRNIGQEQFETQFLLGVPRLELQEQLVSGQYFRELLEKTTWRANCRQRLERLSESGTLVRMYLPFGEDNVAGPYCKRRLKANPNLATYGIKNLLRLS